MTCTCHTAREWLSGEAARPWCAGHLQAEAVSCWATERGRVHAGGLLRRSPSETPVVCETVRNDTQLPDCPWAPHVHLTCSLCVPSPRPPPPGRAASGQVRTRV